MSLQGWAGLGQDWVGKRGTLPTAQRAEAREDMGSWGLCETAWDWGVMWRGWCGEMRLRAEQELQAG